MHDRISNLRTKASPFRHHCEPSARIGEPKNKKSIRRSPGAGYRDTAAGKPYVYVAQGGRIHETKQWPRYVESETDRFTTRGAPAVGIFGSLTLLSSKEVAKIGMSNRRAQQSVRAAKATYPSVRGTAIVAERLSFAARTDRANRQGRGR